MLRYGLFVYGNEYDTFPIDIGVVEDELASKKLQLLEDSMLGSFAEHDGAISSAVRNLENMLYGQK